MPDTPWVIENLAADHDRSLFHCGHDSLDEYIRKYASQNQRSGVSRTFVAVLHGETAVRGYYSISAGAVAFETLPESVAKRLPRYPVPVALLGRLAVDRSAQGRGLGSLLLIDAFRRIEQAASLVGIHAIEVVAIDEAARQFYLKYGFMELREDPWHLFLSLKTIRSLRLQ